MKKHKMSYYEKNDFIEFTLDFCSHSKEIMSDIKKNKKKHLFRKKSFSD
jgi:hypothetical protein